MVTYGWLGRAEIALAQQRFIDALPLAQRSLAVLEAAGATADALANARFVLARALWDIPIAHGRDRLRALALAREARDGLPSAGSQADTRKYIAAWLDARGE